MDIFQTDKLVLFILFVVPGFIGLKTYELLFPRIPKNSFDQLIDAVAYSSINYALLLWPIFEIERSGIKSSQPTIYVAFYTFVLLGAPILWACLVTKIRTINFFQSALPHPTAKPWDYVFGQRRQYWIIVTLKEGKQIAGRYGGQSFASSSPAPEQIYLEETWEINSDGGFERARIDSAGIIILASDITTVEFFHITTGERDDRQETVIAGTSTSGKRVSTGSKKTIAE